MTASCGQNSDSPGLLRRFALKAPPLTTPLTKETRMTPQASSSSSFIQGVLAACGVSIPAADLSELRLEVSSDTVGGEHQKTGPLELSTITVSIGTMGLTITFTCTNGSQLLLCADPSTAIPLIFCTPDSQHQFGCQYNFSVAPNGEIQPELDFVAG